MGPNPSNTWPQMPKVQSMEARAKAYLRVAGLGNKSSSSSSSLPVLDPELDLNSPEVRFGRLLGSTDQRVRHKAVAQLELYLQSRCSMENNNNNKGGGLTELDLLKLWKGLWFTLYMADKVPVQDELSQKLAKLLWCVAGTEEEDEYAGRTYMEMCQEEESDDDDNDNSNNARFMEEEDGDDDDDEHEVVIQEVYGLEEDVESGDGSPGEEDDEEDDEDDDEEEADNDNDDEEEEDDEEESVLEEEEDWLVPHCRGAHLASLFVRTFLCTIRREWGKMDKHRVDKFYTLIRYMMEQIYAYMALRHWSIGIVRLFNDVLVQEILNTVPNGLRLHLIDVTMDELARVNQNAPMALTEATFLDVLEPYLGMAQAIKDKAVHNRIMEKIFDKFLMELSVVGQHEDEKDNDDDDNDDNDEDDNSKIMDQVHVRTVADFLFQLGSDPATRDEHRPVLYDMYKKYMKRLKIVGKDVVLDVPMDDDDDFVGEDEEDGEDEEENEEDGMEEEEEEEEEVVVVEEKKGRRKAKKQKLGNNAKKEETKAATPTKADETKDSVAADQTPQKQKKKRKKNKKKGKEDNKEEESVTPAPATVSDEEEEDKGKEEEEDVITISVAEQKAAASAASQQNKKKKKRKKEMATMQIEENNDDNNDQDKQRNKKTKTDSTEEGSKRVSFGKRNYSKSHKASFKALKRAQPTYPSITSDKSILRNKTPSPVNRTKAKRAKRKKAVDYF